MIPIRVPNNKKPFGLSLSKPERMASTSSARTVGDETRIGMKRAAALLLMLAAALLAPLAWAADQQPVDADRLYRLTSELRCLVCQNESLADSSAPLAIDLKNEIRERMASGESDAQIKKFLVDRYGNFVIYRPPLENATLLLWLGPLLLAVVGAFALWRGMRARPAQAGGDAQAGDEMDDDDMNDENRESQP